MGNTSENFLLTGDVPGLDNAPVFPIVATLTCAVGDSTEPGVYGLADTLVYDPDGGAIAAFAPTGLSLDRYAHVLNKHLIEHLFGAGSDLGTASQGAREDAVLNPDPVHGIMPSWMIEIYHVHGDPAVQLKQ